MTLEQGMMQREKDSDIRSEDEYDDELQDHMHFPQQRNAANARERARMRVLSKAFCRLKTTLPWVPPDTKLSKLDTLRLATGYIAHLRAILKLSENEAPDSSVQPLNMSWPFNFHMNWDSQGSTKSTIVDTTSAKNEWNTCIQEPFKNKMYNEEECRPKSYYDLNGDRRLVSPRSTKNGRKNDNQYVSEPRRHTSVNNCHHIANNYYDSCSYYE